MANEYDLASHKSSVATLPVPILLIIALAIACLGHKVEYEAGTRGAADCRLSRGAAPPAGDILQYLKGAKRTVALADYGMRDMHRGCNLMQLD